MRPWHPGSVRFAVRPASPRDAAAIARVHIAAWRAAYAHIMSADYLRAMDHERWTGGWLRNLTEPAEPRPTTVVGLLYGTVQGFATTGPRRGDGRVESEPTPSATGELWVLNLHPDAFGSGLASELHADALERLVASGHASAVLWVARDNPRARRFYEREGWTPEGLEKSEEIGGAPVVEVRYRRALLD